MKNILKNSFIFIIFVLFVIEIIWLSSSQFNGLTLTSLHVALLIGYLVLKLLLSFLYRPYEGEASKFTVAAVIPSYNEEGETLLTTVKSVLEQTYCISEIYVVDDGSKDKTALTVVAEYLEKYPDYKNRVTLKQLEQNVGKRHAQAWAFERSQAEIFLTVDSDTRLEHNALEEILKPFNDENIFAVTGHLNVRNRSTNLLTRLTDIRYDNAFGVERAAQSVTGNILVCSGPLSVYRREVVIPNLDRYKNQTFLGIPVSIGDDRCLTNYAIDLGKTVYQSTARCETDVPDKISTYIKQQNRWNKSFFRESLISLRKTLRRPMVALWTVVEVIIWILLVISLVNLISMQLQGLQLLPIFTLSVSIIVVALCRNVAYLAKYPLTFLLSPFYGFLHLFILQPLKVYSLLTIRNAGWGTRVKKDESDKVKDEVK